MKTAKKPKIESSPAHVKVPTYSELRKKESEALPDLMKEISQANKKKRLSRYSMICRHKHK